MAEKLQENAEQDGDRKIVVGNLPQHCVEEYLVNYFESRRQFGEGIEVENVTFQNEDVVITFAKASDVDMVIQRHDREPCKLGNRRLDIKSFKSSFEEDDIDVIDKGSSNLIQDAHQSLAGDSYSLKHNGGWSSLDSSISVISFDSSELFGSGQHSHELFSEELSEIHLSYKQKELDNMVLKLNETDVSPVVVSYAATTCFTTGSSQKMQAERRTSSTSPTILHEAIRARFGNEVEVITNTSNITIFLKGEVKTLASESHEGFQMDVLATIKTLENKINVKLCKLDSDRLDFALKHFAHVLSENPTIKIYAADDEFSFFIAFQTENEKVLIDTHIAIVSKQNIEKQEKTLPWADIFKIKANWNRVELLNAKITCNENLLAIEGFTEDINTAFVCINQILNNTKYVRKSLDEFVVDFLREAEIIEDIETILISTGTKVWWNISGQFLNVVATKTEQANKAVKIIVDFFCQRKIELNDYLINSDKWKDMKSLALVNNQKRLCIDDTSDKAFVIIKGTTDRCKHFVDATEYFKQQNIRERRSIPMTKAKCHFAVKHLNKMFEEAAGFEYCKLEQGKDETELIVEATKDGHEKISLKLKAIVSLAYWICDEKDEILLRTMSENTDLTVPGEIHIFENTTQISFVTGRIENAQVDVIVNSAGEDLNLDVGENTITKAINTAAGKQAQIYLEKVKRPANVGDVIKGDPGSLNCKAIYHAILQTYNPNNSASSVEILRNVIRKCLAKAAKEGFTSLAFPAICTGVHKYPVKLVANTIFDSISEFLCKNEETSLKKIIIVFLASDRQKRKTFEDCKLVQENILNDMQGKKEIRMTSWPCRFYCHITAADYKSATEKAEHVISELKEQTQVKKLEHTE